MKYWGKRNAELFLPHNSSISLTLRDLYSKCTIASANEFSISFNEQNRPSSSPEFQKIKAFTDSFKDFYQLDGELQVSTKNNFPTGAGLASSASGYAALTCCLADFFDLQLDSKALSKHARLGSGSATRSILGGFNYWHKGSQADGSDSQIKQIKTANHWPDLNLAVCIFTSESKKVSSRAGMANTVNTCPIYKSAWLGSVEEDLISMEAAIIDRDFSGLGQVAELNALKMHATMLASQPPLVYLKPETLELTARITEWRESGELESYYTIDAGPQVKILYLNKDHERLKQLLSKQSNIQQIIYTGVGPDAHPTEDHLELSDES